tara:strand:- start:55 stop:279 length:225 start_codon:yes stop_codon:yes gene_type:complete
MIMPVPTSVRSQDVASVLGGGIEERALSEISESKADTQIGTKRKTNWTIKERYLRLLPMMYLNVELQRFVVQRP